MSFSLLVCLISEHAEWILLKFGIGRSSLSFMIHFKFANECCDLHK